MSLNEQVPQKLPTQANKIQLPMISEQKLNRLTGSLLSTDG